MLFWLRGWALIRGRALIIGAYSRTYGKHKNDLKTVIFQSSRDNGYSSSEKILYVVPFEETEWNGQLEETLVLVSIWVTTWLISAPAEISALLGGLAEILTPAPKQILFK